MKIRNCHVSNSSSSSFIIALDKDSPEYNKVRMMTNSCHWDEDWFEDTKIDKKCHRLDELMDHIRRTRMDSTTTEEEMREAFPREFAAIEDHKVVMFIRVDYSHERLYDYLETLGDSIIEAYS